MSETLESIINDPKTPAEYKIAKLGPWFHNLHLPDGTETAPNHPLGDFPAFKWEKIQEHLPSDLTGWSVLDIGCNAGFYCFELARRGASVTGIDADSHYLRQARWAVKLYDLKDKVNFRQMQVYDLMQSREKYDMILFMGVFYHLRYPLLALDIAARKFTRMMIFQSLTMPGEEVYKVPDDLPIDSRDKMLNEGWPKMAFIENSLAGDKTNWWAPNHAAIEAMLRSAGLKITGRPGHEFYICVHDDMAVDGVDQNEMVAALNAVKRLI
ncbi:MAG: TIGR04290 family methyltransferase [Syntrophothermus sp.]